MASDLPEAHPDEYDGSVVAATASSSSSGGGGGIDNYIASLHLERSNTRAVAPSALQRRRTLIKQASDPTADQEALELEIRQVERLASLLGRRQTKFDRKRGRPTVNHDLDATLEGFFEVQDDNERVADILLSGTHSAAVYSLGHDDLGDGIENPELKHANIHSAPATLIATQFEPEYGQVVDPFDRIDEMHLAKSPSGSAELGPALPQIPDDLDEDDELSEEEETPREGGLSVPQVSIAYQGALPEHLPEAVAPALFTTEGNAPSMEDAFVTGVYPTDAPSTAVVTDYFDILDFMDAKEHSDIEMPEKNDEDDGHISSDLLANSDSSDIDLSGNDSSDSDDQYLSKIGQQRMLRVANVVDAPLADASQHAGSVQQPGASASTVNQQRSSAMVSDAEAENAVGLSSHSTLRRSRRILTKGKSIRRGSTSQQSTRAQPVVSTQAAEASLSVSIPESRPAGGAVPSSRWSVVGADEQVLASHRVSAPSAYPAAHSAVARARVAAPSTRPDSLFSAGRSGPPAGHHVQMAAASPAYPGIPAPTPGLAQLAEAAQAAAAAQLSGTRAARGLSVSAIGGARHKPLPPVPDRISRTLQAADAAAQEALAAGSSIATAGPGRAPPPLPAKARPKIPQALAGDKLSTRAAIAAALERPSSQALFGADVVRASSHQASLEHMPLPAGAPGMHRAATTQPALAAASPLGLQAWLQRTDILAPPPTIPETLSMPLEMPTPQQRPHTARPMTASRRKSMRARSRVVRKVAVPSLPLQEPTLRPASSNSSIHSSASHEDGPSPPTSPVLAPNSLTVTTTAIALERLPMASTSTTTTTAQGAYPYPYSHDYEPMPAVSGPTVLSAPPGSELIEPSAPMLLEPTAPELPEQWDMSPYDGAGG
ncbi:hypothetical protein GGI01_003112 [Coemansia sp. RSA 376]|nr:hypothetical protein GGI01_003112 [Coemansia sp. RSA 376]